MYLHGAGLTNCLYVAIQMLDASVSNLDYLAPKMPFWRVVFSNGDRRYLGFAEI